MPTSSTRCGVWSDLASSPCADRKLQNVIWTFAMFWFMIFNSFDATYLYQYTFILLYNLVFTSLPVIALGGQKRLITLPDAFY